MLVTAHPDDETMFFAPFILEAIKQNKIVHLLCLSKGFEPGLTRYEELINATTVLSIHHVEVYGVHNNLLPNVPYFQDGFKEEWPKDGIASVVEHFRQKWKIDTIVTFDQDGVSKHPNHKSTFKGVLQHVRHFREEDLSYFVLRSTPLPQKYLSWLGVFWEIITRRKKSNVIINTNPVVVWNAMKKYQSQLVWYRKIYLFFSTFVYLNILVQPTTS